MIINLEFPPVGGPGVQRVLKFVRYLPQEGWTPTVICGDRSTWHDYRDDTLLEEVPKDVDVFRLAFTTIEDMTSFATSVGSHILLPLRTFLGKDRIRDGLKYNILNLLNYMHPEPLLSWVFVATRKAMQCQEMNRCDLVLTSGPPHMTHMVGLVLKRFYQVKWVADFRDPWVDCRLNADRLGISRRLHWFWERLVLKEADRVVSVSPSWAELLSRKLNGRRRSKVHVVYNGYDPNDIPNDLPEVPRAGSDSDILRIHYNGTIQGPMLPVLFFKALAELKKERPNLHRDLSCTFTGLPANIAQLANGLKLNQVVRSVGRLSHRESLQMSLSSDVVLLILNDADKTVNGQITGKVYEYMAMGKSILSIVPTRGDLYSLLKEYEQSFVVAWDDLARIVGMLKLLMRKKRKGELNLLGPPSWIAQYSRQTQTIRLARILEDLDLDHR